MSNSFFSRRLGHMQAPPNELARAVTELRRSGAPVCDLSVSNPTVVGLACNWEPIQSSLTRAATDVYAPASLGRYAAREAIATHLGRAEADEHGFFDAGINPGFEAARIMLTASTSDSYSYVFKVVADPGDCILVPTPSYPLLEHLIALDGLRAVPYRLSYDGAWHVDWDSVNDALASRPKAIVIVTPNNPTASCLTEDEFRRFAALGVPLIVDQVFAPFARRGNGMRALPYQATDTLSFVLDGFSKRCALPQLKVGWIAVFGSSTATDEAMKALELVGDAYLGVNSVSEGAVGSILDATAPTRRLIRARLAANLEHIQHLDAKGAAFSQLHYQGGWTALLRLPNFRSDDEWARLLLEVGVIVQPGWLYDCVEPATSVVSLLTPEDVFAAGLARLLDVIEA